MNRKEIIVFDIMINLLPAPPSLLLLSSALFPPVSVLPVYFLFFTLDLHVLELD